MKCPTCGAEDAQSAFHKCGPPLSKFSIRSRRDRRPGWKIVILSLLAGVVVAGVLFAVGIAGTKVRLQRRFGQEQTVKLEPGERLAYVFTRDIQGVYRFEVISPDGPLFMMIEKIDEQDSDEIDSEVVGSTFREHAYPVEAGKGRMMQGRIEPGRYLWGVLNTSEDKAVRLTIRFRISRDEFPW